jgi:hypothetical protein
VAHHSADVRIVVAFNDASRDFDLGLQIPRIGGATSGPVGLAARTVDDGLLDVPPLKPQYALERFSIVGNLLR